MRKRVVLQIGGGGGLLGILLCACGKAYCLLGHDLFGFVAGFRYTVGCSTCSRKFIVLER